MAFLWQNMRSRYSNPITWHEEWLIFRLMGGGRGISECEIRCGTQTAENTGKWRWEEHSASISGDSWDRQRELHHQERSGSSTTSNQTPLIRFFCKSVSLSSKTGATFPTTVWSQTKIQRTYCKIESSPNLTAAYQPEFVTSSSSSWCTDCSHRRNQPPHDGWTEKTQHGGRRSLL